MEFRVLGPLEVVDDGAAIAVPGSRERALLALLVASAGQVVAADRLAEALWGDDLPRHPANALQAQVSRLRKTLGPAGPEVVLTRPSGYVLQVDPDRIDAHRFERLAAEGRRRLGQEPARAVELLSQALALWRGEAFPELADSETGRAEAIRLEELRLAAQEDRIDALLAAGHHTAAMRDLEGLVRAHPLRERLWGQLMLALYRSGRQADALRAYQEARRVLVDELGIDPSPELRRLEAAILAQDPSLDPPPAQELEASTAGRHNLPARPTSFVGRWSERQAVAKLVLEHRLVTLSGPGGVGKTSLALEVAGARVGHEPGGVWLVELGPLAEPGLVVPEVAATLGIQEPGPMGVAERDSLAARLVERVSLTEPLLVLDNCEHVVEACADLAATLLSAAPGVRILATSREPLNVAGEVLWPVPPLAVPEAEQPVEELAASDAVRLFVERAGASGRDFTLDADSAPAVAAICRRLDGIPLAIELAAARTRSLPVRDIATRLDDRFRLLTGGRRDAPARHQTLEAALDWSHELLSGPEQALFRRLSVFAGSFSVPATEAIAAGGDVEPEAVLELLARLVDRSLVVAEGTPDARFRLLETVREYARARLSQAGETEELSRRHAAWFRDLAEETERLMPKRGGRWVLETLEQEEDELRAAMDRSLARGDTETALRLGGALGWFWFVRRRGEGAERLAAVLAAADHEPSWARGRALQAAGLVGVWPHTDQATEWAAESLAIFERFGDAAGVASSKALLGGSLASAGRVDEAVRLLAEAEEGFRRLGDRWHEGVAWRIRSWACLMRGEPDRADEFGRRTLERFRELDDPWGISSALGQLAVLAMRRGDYGSATELYEEAAALAREMGLWDNVHLALSELGTLAALSGDHERAKSLHHEALEAGRAMGSRLHLAHTYNGMGLAARLRGDAAAARHLHGDALALYRELGAPGGVVMSLGGLGFAEELDGDLDSAEAHHREALALATSGASDPLAVPLALEGLAGVAAARGRAERATLLLGAAASAREAAGYPLPPAERFDVERAASRARSRLDDRRFSDVYDRGRELGLAAAVELALEEGVVTG